MFSNVIRPRPAASEKAIEHFKTLLEYETDCWDVNYAMNNGLHDFVLLDVRAESVAKKGYIEGAEFMPQMKINKVNMEKYPSDTVFVVYCAGPHCNATEKAALKLARLGRPVKKMIGGATGWVDEGFELVSDE